MMSFAIVDLCPPFLRIPVRCASTRTAPAVELLSLLYTALTCQHLGAVGSFASLVLRPILWFLAAPQIIRFLSNAKSAAQVPNHRCQLHGIYDRSCCNRTAHRQYCLPASVETARCVPLDLPRLLAFVGCRFDHSYLKICWSPLQFCFSNRRNLLTLKLWYNHLKRTISTRNNQTIEKQTPRRNNSYVARKVILQFERGTTTRDPVRITLRTLSKYEEDLHDSTEWTNERHRQTKNGQTDPERRRSSVLHRRAVRHCEERRRCPSPGVQLSIFSIVLMVVLSTGFSLIIAMFIIEKDTENVSLQLIEEVQVGYTIAGTGASASCSFMLGIGIGRTGML